MTRIAALVAAGALLLAACSPDAAGTTTIAATRAGDDPARLVAADAAVTPGTVTIDLDGVTWTLPRSACLAASGDPDAARIAADDAAGRVRDLVADRVSGWPTTTAPMAGDDPSFFVEVNRWGPVALTLGTVAGTRGDVVAAWTAFEQRYADPGGGWGPVTDIATRLTGWGATADRLVAALAGAC